MKLLIKGGRVIDPASGRDGVGDIAVVAGRIIAIGSVSADFAPNRVINAVGCIVAPGLVDLAARLGEPGHEHEGMLESELAAAAAGGVTSLVCPPDTDPVLDEPGLVEMLRLRAERTHRARVHPLGALTRGLAGTVLTEMVALTEAGCVGFSQAEVPLVDTLVLQRALQYAATFGYRVWLRPVDAYLGRGVAAGGAVATRLGLSSVPVAAETIALHTIFELMRSTGAAVHLCRLSSAAGVALVRQAKAAGLPVTCDVSINSLHFTDADIGYFDTRMRVSPPLRQAADRAALRSALQDGTIDALVSDHTPVKRDEKRLPFAEAQAGATGLELLAGAALAWRQPDLEGAASERSPDWLRTLAVLTSGPAAVLGSAIGTLAASVGRLVVGGVADICLIEPEQSWQVTPDALRSQGRHTPFSDQILPGRVRCTIAGGLLTYEWQPAARQPDAALAVQS
ncbi:MAG: dihydroorotase [Burkholderiales bacterium]